MKNARGRFRYRPIGLIVTATACLAALACYVSYRTDAAVIRAKAVLVAAGHDQASDKARAIMAFIHRHPGTGANQDYFLIPGMRATPMSVLAHGGDCADKGRLLSAMLRELDIPSTMAMCFNPKTKAPTHTVIEAVVERGNRMVLDPAFDLCFPRPDGDGYYGLLDMRRDPLILINRLDSLWYKRPYPSPCHAYDFDRAPYTAASTINWNKSNFTRWVRDKLYQRIGDRVYQLPRPLAMEEPKLLIVTLCLAIAAANLLAMGVIPLTAAAWRSLRRLVSKPATAASCAVRGERVAPTSRPVDAVKLRGRGVPSDNPEPHVPSRARR